MSRYRFAPLAFDGISTYPLASRPSKVTTADFARPVQEDSSLKEFFASLPNLLAARELKELAARIREARKQQRAIIIGLGGHVIKTGLAPVLIDLIERGYATAFAMRSPGRRAKMSTPRSAPASSAWLKKRAASSTKPYAQGRVMA